MNAQKKVLALAATVAAAVGIATPALGAKTQSGRGAWTKFVTPVGKFSPQGGVWHGSSEGYPLDFTVQKRKAQFRISSAHWTINEDCTLTENGGYPRFVPNPQPHGFPVYNLTTGELDTGNLWQYNAKGVWYVAHVGGPSNENFNISQMYVRFIDRKHARGFVEYSGQKTFPGVSLRCNSLREYWRAHR